MALRFALMAALAAAILALAVTAPGGSSARDRSAPSAQLASPNLPAPRPGAGG